MDDRQPVPLARRALSYLICYLVAVQPMLPAVAAQITPVTPGTKMDAAGNGVPVINIATPNAAGVSHNQYQQYNVGQEGMILNNATGQLTPTQLGGLIQNNPNLKAGHEAQAIINEVTGASRSQLQGYTEVAGKAANVMVANPYGITCNGCGFINTPNVTLTTGKPQLDANGNLSSLEVTKGSVTIEGKGLDGSSADAVSIMARATEINAGIHAKDLSVTTGANRVGADGSVTPIAGEGTAPSVAVDTGALGGMYANRIHLVSSEKGVGVNLGNLVAKQGDIQLDASGKLTLSNSLSSGALRANGSSVVLSGDNKATGQITVSAQQDATLGQGTLVSDDGIAVTAKGNLTSNGSGLTAGHDIRLNGATLAADQSTRVNAGSNIQLQAQNQISNSGQLTAADNLSVGTRQLNNSGALAAGAINIKAGTLKNSKGASVAATRSLTTVSDKLLNQGVLSAPVLDISSAQTDNSGMLQGTSALRFSGTSLNNLSGGTLSSNNGFALNLPTLDNHGLISSGAALTLSGHSLTNSGEINAHNLTALNDVLLNNAGGSLLAADALQLANRELDNSGKVAAVKLALNSDAINNSGTLQARQTLQTQSQQLTNTGTVLSEDQLTLDTAALTNAGSLQGRLLNISADNWLNSGKALSLAEGRLKTGSLNNTGSLFSQQALQLSSGETDNSGLIQGTTALRFTGQRLTNLANGTVSSDNSFRLDLPELNNAGLISSGATLTLSGGTLINAGEISAAGITADNNSLNNQQGGLLLADNAVQLKNSHLSNAGQVAASQLNISSATVENSGTLQGKQTLQATGQQLTNSGTVLSGGQLTLKQDRLDNRGQMQGQQIDLTAGSWQNSGNTLSAGDATLAADTLTNSGKILGQQHITVKGSTDNSGWLLAQALTLQGDLVNSGLLQGTDALTLQGNKLVNQDNGQVLTAGLADLQSASLNNQGSLQADQLNLTLDNWQNAGSARATRRLSASVSGVLDNSGKLMSEQAMNLLSSRLSNSGALAADRLTITAPQLANSGVLQGNSTLTLSSGDITNTATGQLISGNTLALSPVTLTNAGLLQVAGELSLTGHNVSNSGRITATSLSAGLDGTLDNSAGGLMLAQHQADLQVNTLNNAGTIAAQQVNITGGKLQNQGLLQGDVRLTAEFGQLDNLLHGQFISGGELALNGGAANNAGVWQGKNLGYHFTSLFSTGTINGTGSLSGTSDTLLENSGSLLSGGQASVSAVSMKNSGKIMADSLTLRGESLSNRGLWQGTTALDAQASDHLTQSAGGQTLSGGDLLLNAGSLETAGTLQGERVHVSAGGWQHQGSLLSGADLTTSVSGDLNNQGELLSQGTTQINAQNVNNSGKLLAEKGVTLSGSSLINSGTVQGDTLAIRPTSVTNQGSLIGLQSLTLEPAPARGLRLFAVQAQPARTLINDAGGQLLTQGTLHISSDTVTNNGTWQGQQILLDASRLANGGAIQSAGDLQLNLRDTLTSAAGSKISSSGSAALNALSLTNQGQWIARNLTLQGNTLNNSGEISGVEGLTTTVSGALTQQQNAALLSGGTLDAHAAAVDNAGRMQGKDLLLNSGSVTNSGRMQGDSSLLLNAGGGFTNSASGTVLSQSGLTLSAPELYNYGLIQGASSRIATGGLITNSGKVLSSADLTLNAPQLINSGWLQASQLALDAASASNSGTLMADQQATLTGSSLQNQGTAQGGNLTVNYAQLTNSGTLLGTNQLNINATQVTQQAAGKLFSGGNLLLESTGFDQLGQVVALGDATLKLINGFTARDTLAAGNHLNITSLGAIDNQGTLQGQALTLSAGGDLTNNGQITTGTGDSSLIGQRINMNGAGTLQGGGNVALTSRSDVALNSFTGTRGNLTISSPGSIVNTALLYAGQNLYLYANSITNQRGDMLAGNSLWMQRDAAGNANSGVINTSGNIESQNGDITIKTGHLLNQRDGYHVTEETHQYFDGSADYINLPVSTFDPSQYTLTTEQSCGGGRNDSCRTHHHLNLNKEQYQQKVLIGEKIVGATASGGVARIAAGRDLITNATTLDNLASDILAGRNSFLSGDSLNNNSSATGRYQTWQTYDCAVTSFTACSQNIKDGKISSAPYFRFGITGQPEYVSVEDGYSYRAVIQAGGNVNASFSSDISNTSTAPNAVWAGTIINAPALNHLAAISQVAAQQRQQLGTTNKVAINSPEWHDQLNNALQQVNGGTSLQHAQPETLSLTNQNGKQQGPLNPGKAIALASGDAVKPSALGSYGASKVDTSAYPLPTSDNGYFVPGDSSSPYLITVNPKLNGLGQLDTTLFSDLNQLLGKQPGNAPQETRQQYTDVNTFLGSSYLLDRLNLKPDHDYRFLGDAAFDTRYVSNVVLNQTGNRYLHGVGSDLDQMRYLMDNAAAARQSLGLQFGVSLNADQVAALDKSIIWWEATSVNGQTVMVPKVYLSANDAVMNNGSVIAGNNVTLSGGNITNSASSIVAQNAVSADSQNRIDNLNAGLIKAGGDLQLSALNSINNVSSTISGKKVALESVSGDINNTTVSSQWTVGGKGALQASKTLIGQTAAITALDTLSLKSGNNITITGASLNAGGDLLLSAWHDLSLNNIATRESRQIGNKETHSFSAERTTVSSGGNLTLKAGQDITSQAAALAAEGDIGLKAGHDINLNSVESGSGSSERSSKKTRINETVRQQGTEMVSGGGTTLLAANDINTRAATITANKDLALQAGNNVNITTATESDYAYREETKTKKSLFGKKTTHTIKEDSSTREKASSLSGDRVSIIAGNDLLVKGSSVVGESDVGLKAGNDLTIAAATETKTSYRLSETKKSGMFSGGGIGVTFGSASSKQELKQNGTTESQSASTIGSTGGNVTLVAGHDARVAGSDVIAKQDISVIGGSVTIDPGNDTLTRRQRSEQKQSGLTLQLTSPITDALLSLGAQAKAAGEAGDDRLKALNAVKMAESGWAMSKGATQSATALAKGNLRDAGMKVSLSVGASKSTSSSEYSSNTVSGSALNGGGNVAIVATGTNGASGDVLLAGSSITGGNVTLAATHDLNLIAASNNTEQKSSNTSSGWNAGAHLAIGQKIGIGVQANGYMAGGAENGSSTTYVNSRVNAKDNLTLSSGNDTLLSGAQALGKSINVNAGNNLTLTSLQDTDNYQSKQHSASGGFSFTFGNMNGSLGLSLSQSRVNSDYASVGDQSGLFAGNGGYDIFAGNHTQLNGAVIASTADAANNHLSTGTLGWDNLNNHAEYTAKSSAIGLSAGFDDSQAAGEKFAGSALPALVNMHERASGTTRSAVADGTIILRDAQRQTQNVAELSHDTANANGHIDKIFDKEKVANQMAFAQGVQELAGKVVGDVMADKLDTAAAEAKARLLKEHPDYASKSPDELNSLVQHDPAYKAVAEKWGTGGTYSMVATAVAGALGGLGANNLGAAAGGAMAPYIANAIKQATTTHNADGTENVNLVANTMAHAVAGAVLAQISGNSAAAGAAGAAGGELAARAIVRVMYPDTDITMLTESQKQMVSTLSQLAAGLAGGIASDTSMGAGAGAGAGKNAVENNALSDLTDALAKGKTPQQVATERVDAENERYKQQNCAGMSADACSVKMYTQRREELKNMLSTGVDFVPVVGDIKSFAEAQSALDYLAAAIGIIPGAGDAAGKAIKAAEIALKKGDVAEASRLINEGSRQVSAKAKDVQIWTETKKKEPVSNAYGHWDKHKKEFPQYQNSKQYVEAAHSFVTKPPSGTLIKTRPNGDTLYYNPATNTFASKDASGVPRTMFKPEKGMEYWSKQ